MAAMMRGTSLREAMIRPAMSYSRRLVPRKRALCTSTTKTTPPVVSPLPRSAASTDITAATTGTEEGNPTGGGPSTRKSVEWRPSEVHRASATSLRRKEAEKARPKSAGVAARVATAGGVDSRSPGLRRRELLGGIEDATPRTELASTPATTPAPVRPTLQTEATAAGERSVVSSSATEKFRRRRELDRLAAAGNAEAQEAIRALGSTSSLPRPDSATSPGSKGANEGGDGDQSDRASGGLTPLTVLPLLLALIAAGYCAANDLLPVKWLPSSGGRGATGGGSPGQDSTVARSEGYREYALDDGEGVGKKGGGVVEREGERSLGGSLRWQRRQPSSAASPLSKTLSRASSAPENTTADNAPATTTATVSTGAPADGWRTGKAWLGIKAAGQGTNAADQGTPNRASVSGADGERESGGGSRWGWWGPEGVPQAGGEGVVASGRDPSAAVVFVGAGDGEGGGRGTGDGKGAQRAEAGKQLLWLQRWRAPASSRSS